MVNPPRKRKPLYGACFILVVALASAALAATTAQVAIDRIEQMPGNPTPYILRDWKRVARDYDAFIFDFTKTGENLPLPWWDRTRLNFERDVIGLPSYVGTPFQTSANAHESINTAAAVVGATLVGINKANQNGQNWVLQQENYLNKANGQNLFLNLTATTSGQSFWYEIFPHILFYQLVDLYPGIGTMDNEMLDTANLWYQCALDLGGKNGAANFDHTAYNVITRQAVDNGQWKEPDAAAGVAWLEYMAYMKSKIPQYLAGADMAFKFLDERTQNPYYECLLPFGALAAARANAEQGRAYDVKKLVNWCFDGSSTCRPGWGVIADRWGDADAHGLLAGLTDGGGYAFAMNTYAQAAALVPLTRYDEHFARAIGKWMSNAAVNSRLFYPNALAADHQSCAAWAAHYDPASCIAYEGVRKNARFRDWLAADVTTSYGVRVSGSGDFSATHYLNDSVAEVLEEATVEDHDQLDHIWSLNLRAGSSHTLLINAWRQGGDGESFIFSYGTSPNGPFTDLVTIDSTAGAYPANLKWPSLPAGLSGTIFLKVRDSDRAAGHVSHDRLTVDSIFVLTESAVSPYGMGDGLSGYPWGVSGKGMTTDLGLYGSSHVGYLAAIVSPTNVEGILQLDCLATDFFRAPAYPTYLYYNPYTTAKDVQIDVGASPRDLYDALGNQFLKSGVNGTATFSVPADSALLLVLTPTGGKVTYSGAGRGRKMLVDGVVADYMLPLVWDTALLSDGPVWSMPMNGSMISASEAGLRVEVAAGATWAIAAIPQILVPPGATRVRAHVAEISPGARWVIKLSGYWNGAGSWTDWLPFNPSTATGWADTALDGQVIARQRTPLEYLQLGLEGLAGDHVVFNRLEFYTRSQADGHWGVYN